MKLRIILIIIYLIHYCSCFSQLNCNTIKDAAANTVKTCYHKNNKVSVVETWDKAKRTGKIQGYNNAGKELFSYFLRNFAGHAHVYVEYYTNGQVKKAEYSSAPDGGIQFWHIIQKFDEQGNQTEYTDLSQPDGHPTLIPRIKDSLFQPQVVINPKIPEKKKDSIIACAPIFNTQFKICNETNSKLTIQLKAQNNSLVLLKDTTLTIKSKQVGYSKEITLSKGFLLQNEAYSLEIIGSPRKKKKIKIIEAKPIETPQQKTYVYHLIKS